MNNLKKDYFWNTLGTSLFSFNSLFFIFALSIISVCELRIEETDHYTNKGNDNKQ